MKKDYIKPIVGIVMLASEIIMDENSGVADKPRAKDADIEIDEIATETPEYTNIWDEEEKED